MEDRGKEPVHISETSEWLRFLNPIMFPKNISSMFELPNAHYAYHCLYNAASKPYPDWALIIRGLLGRNYLGAKTILQGICDYFVELIIIDVNI